MAASLICSDTVSRVSSVLNRDAKQFGKKYMFDCNEETCWNSDQGLSQWVLLQFPRASRVSAVILQFQGGFSAKTCRLEGTAHRDPHLLLPAELVATVRDNLVVPRPTGCLREGTFVKITDFYPEDNNSSQISFESSLQAVLEPLSFTVHLILKSLPSSFV
uniref:Nuclear receptor 2C2-associated protein n=1 Tax=Scleropages formosus TaxID=113540 RepID=A0A8C9W5B6_SCLFO